jgi:hypothetical protein
LKELNLSGKHGIGKVALVDDDVYEWANKYKWYVKIKEKTGLIERVGRSSSYDGKDYHIALSHAVVGKPISKNTVVDHIDRNPLNNQRSNLRYCSLRDNARNQSLRSNNTTGYRGIQWDASRQHWVVYIKGRFKNLEEAIEFRDKAATVLFGDFAGFTNSTPVV